MAADPTAAIARPGAPGDLPVPQDLEALPGGDLVRRGLEDLAAGRESVESLLVSIGEPRLRQIGLAPAPSPVANPEHRLYELLAAADPDAAHSRYNALIRRLTSFERSAACAG